MTKPASNLISDEYRAQLQEKHAGAQAWGDTGVRQWASIANILDNSNIKSVLDYGCGKGAVGKKIREEQDAGKYAGMEIFEYDPGIPGKEDTDSVGELLINIDVLEHIEPDMLENVLADMGKRTGRFAFLVIDCIPAIHKLPDGQQAHLILERPDWWIARLRKHFTIAQAEHRSNELFVLAVRKQDAESEFERNYNTTAAAITQSLDYTSQKKYALARESALRINDPLRLYVSGRISYEAQDYTSAIGYLGEYLKERNLPDAIRLIGLALTKTENFSQALKALESHACTSIYMDDSEYLAALMLCWNKQFQPRKTVDLFEKRIAEGKTHDAFATDAYVQALILLQDLKGALAAAQKATDTNPDDHMLWAILGHAFDINKMFADATRASRRSIELDPENAGYYSNLGMNLMHELKLDDALASYNEATKRDPILMAAYINRANIYRIKADYAAEEAELRKALEIDPTQVDAHYGLGISRLHQEDYHEGFAHTEWFWHKNVLTSTRVPENFRRWFGEDLNNKNILVYADQGIGDTLMMTRYIPLLLERGAKQILLNVNDKLRDLFAFQFKDLLDAGKIHIFHESQNIGAAHLDFSVAFSTLPHAFGTSIDNVPSPGAYLKKNRTIDYKTDGKDFVIGISWYTQSMDSGFRRSLKLMDFAFLSHIPNARIVNLQYGDTTQERMDAATQGFDIVHDDSINPWNDIQASADQIAACDLVISIDNTTVHTAGALAVPCWVILPAEPYWRWPVNGNVTPWYESVRMFRAHMDQPYTATINDIQAALKTVLAGDRSNMAPQTFTPAFPQAKKKTALLINDTGGCYTWGTHAGVVALKNGLAKKGYDVKPAHVLELAQFSPRTPDLKSFDDPAFLSHCRYRDPSLFYYLQNADVVVINGEGMMSGLSDSTLHLMYLAYVAKNLFGRKTGIVNHACFPENNFSLTDAGTVAYYLKTYKPLDTCVVTDSTSLSLLRSLGVNAELGFDASLLSLQDHNEQTASTDKRPVIFAGPGYSSTLAPVFADLCRKLSRDGKKPIILTGAEWQPSQEDRLLASDMGELAHGDVDLVIAASMDEFMTTIKKARVVIGGFLQNLIMAKACGVPVIPVTGGSMGLTISALAKEGTLPAPLFYQEAELNSKLTNAVKNVMKHPLAASRLNKDEFSTLHARALKNLEAF